MAVRHPVVTLVLVALLAAVSLGLALVTTQFDPAAIPADALHGH